MTLVATLVADPARFPLDHRLLAEARIFLGGGAIRVLAEAAAIDIDIDIDIAGAGAAARPALGEVAGATIPTPAAANGDRAHRRDLAEALRARLAAPIDVAVQPAAGRRKRLLVADMDSTMIGEECIDELAGVLGLKEKVAAITEQAMRGEIAFEGALRERVALLAGIDTAVIDRLLADTIRLTPGARTLVQTMRRHGAHTALVSGGFTAFAGPVAARLGIDEVRANTLAIAGGRLTGRVVEPILGAGAKRDRLEALTRELRLARTETLAVGDGANDLAMLAAAGRGVAFHAKPTVAAAADARIDHGDLTALLYYQGYRASEFVHDS